jgi:hypothetical protein
VPDRRISGLAVAEGIAGFVLLWSGLKNTTLKDTLTAFAKGKLPTSTPEAAPEIGIASGAATTAGTAATGGSSASAPAAPADLSANEAMGKLMAAAHGWTGAQWDALYALWERESGWNNFADNEDSGAYGIPQSLPPTKMPLAAQAAGGSSAAAQIAWGLSYIASTYGSPEQAWAHEEANGWY